MPHPWVMERSASGAAWGATGHLSVITVWHVSVLSSVLKRLRIGHLLRGQSVTTMIMGQVRPLRNLYTFQGSGGRNGVTVEALLCVWKLSGNVCQTPNTEAGIWILEEVGGIIPFPTILPSAHIWGGGTTNPALTLNSGFQGSPQNALLLEN